ncbi:ORF6N domain-containing protein [Parabacteroides johnsonii]|uniref:ORF6N domain-containing protein n=1 Tax=Parabacteroides johnsonii TaxID=387661 RepID=UPI00189AADE3|nr:ORF6N domain-containing protein [Parabacteroides johnsonii]MCS3049200.1 ORF6N domain-containing protein [Parabacteroides johnsonii]
MEELQVIQNKIYEIRGTKVMLDFDLAEIYQVETRVLNQAVKRNIARFPEDFMFQLTNTELDIMSSHFVMTLKAKRPKSALPFAFTEHGVIMLASVLRSEIAIQTSILITRAFVAIRKLVSTPPTDKITEIQQEIKELKEYIEEAFTDYNDINEDTRMQLELINQTIAELQSKKAFNDKLRPRIGFVK